MMNLYYQPYWLQPDELEHHGIKNQKWGIRNGPPYPLDRKEWLSGVKRKTRNMTPEEDCKVVNAGNKKGRVANCVFCAAATEMRFRGYDVIAQTRDLPIDFAKFRRWFTGTDNDKDHGVLDVGKRPRLAKDSWADKTYQQLRSELSKYEDGARGVVRTKLDNNGTGHVLNWIVKRGKVNFYDGQIGLKNPYEFFFKSRGKFTYIRLDKAKEEKTVLEACMNRENDSK